jgi:hypothetical protein
MHFCATSAVKKLSFLLVTRYAIYNKGESFRIRGGSMRADRVIYSLLALVLFMVSPAIAATADAPRITKEEAKALLGAPKVVFIDGRISSAWDRSNRKIPGAVRADSWDLETWAADYDKDTTFIVY